MLLPELIFQKSITTLKRDGVMLTQIEGLKYYDKTF